MTKPINIVCIVGARPNFMKIAPIMSALREYPRLRAVLVHTGQHYDAKLKGTIFEQLEIPEPDVDLGVGSGTHAVQTAETMLRFEPVLDKYTPGAVLVVGDVNSTIACGLVAAKRGIPLIHVEAGLRSYDRAMPEEINRVLTDQISDVLFTTERSAFENLQREGIAAGRIHFSGNVMIDTLFKQLDRVVPARSTLTALGCDAWEQYGIVTLHRPSNVDDAPTLKRLMQTLMYAARSLPLVFPVHPRTRARIAQLGMGVGLDPRRFVLTEPLGYHEMLGLMRDASLMFTDSGGLQEETTALGVPCITLRENTERPITVEQGTNTVAGTTPERILSVFDETLRTGGKRGRIPELWDGCAAQRIAAVTEEWIVMRREETHDGRVAAREKMSTNEERIGQ